MRDQAAHPRRYLLMLTTCTLVLVVWLVSHWYAFGMETQWTNASREIVLSAGCIEINDVYFPGIDPAPWHVTGRALSRPWGMWNWTWYHDRGIHVEFIHVPLWWAIFVTAGPPLWLAYRRHRRCARGQCPSCGYDLAGLPTESSPCPECGASSPRRIVRRAL